MGKPGMTDLDRAIAAAREAVNRINAIPNAGMTNGEHALVHLIAALDAARGEAVAWCCPQTICDADGYPEESETPYMEWGQARPDWQGQWTPLFAAPPAAERDESPIDIGGECVPRWIVEYANALTTYFAERGGRSWAIGGVQSREKAPPAAVAVPEGYAEAIKAVQEMMPPRDFRPSAQVWLTGNQVNELHARLDAAAMLAAERKECKV